MSNYYANYSQYLAVKSCCSAGEMVGPQGPPGPSLTGPTGFTGAPGPSYPGATGKPKRGPTGPTGTAGGYDGPTGPTGPGGAPSFIALTFNPSTSSITIPSQSSPITYFTLNLANGQSLDSIVFASPLPIGYQAIVFVYGPVGFLQSAIVSSSINNSGFVSNIASSLGTLNFYLAGSELNATLSIVSDGTKYYCNAIQYTN